MLGLVSPTTTINSAVIPQQALLELMLSFGGPDLYRRVGYGYERGMQGSVPRSVYKDRTKAIRRQDSELRMNTMLVGDRGRPRAMRSTSTLVLD